MKSGKVSGYIDLFLLPIPKKGLNAYKKIAQRFGKIIMKHGALEYREFIGEDLFGKSFVQFPSKIKLKPDEVLISSVIGFRSKAHRNEVNKKMMKDPDMQKMMTEPMVFDMKRMLYGGFTTIVEN